MAYPARPPPEVDLVALREYRDNLIKHGLTPTGSWHKLLDMVTRLDSTITRHRFQAKSDRWWCRPRVGS